MHFARRLQGTDRVVIVRFSFSPLKNINFIGEMRKTSKTPVNSGFQSFSPMRKYMPVTLTLSLSASEKIGFAQS